MSNRRVDLAEGFTLAVRGMKRTRHEYKKAVRRLHHPPPDGFAKLLGGENFGSSIPALHLGGKTTMTRPFHDYPQLELLWAFVLETRTSVRDKSGYPLPRRRAMRPMAWCGGRERGGQRGIGAVDFIYLHSNSGFNRQIRPCGVCRVERTTSLSH